MTAAIDICDAVLATLDSDFGAGACGRPAGHDGRCVDARVLPKYGCCRHGWLGTGCEDCKHEPEGTT